MRCIKNCPFCGGAPLLEQDSRKEWQVRCDTDRCPGNMSVWEWSMYTEAEAIEAWSRRAAPDVAGWRLVPIEPTDAMIAAWMNAPRPDIFNPAAESPAWFFAEPYRAMLAAAPTATPANAAATNPTTAVNLEAGAVEASAGGVKR